MLQPSSYSDSNCDVERDSEGRFSTDVIIQHHDMIVTSADIGLQVLPTVR